MNNKWYHFYCYSFDYLHDTMNICRFTLFLFLSATIEGVRLYIKHIINTIYAHGVLMMILFTLFTFISSYIYHNSNGNSRHIIRYIDICVSLCSILYHLCFYVYFEVYRYSYMVPIAYVCTFIAYMLGQYVSNEIIGQCFHAFVHILPYIACMDTYDFILNMINKSQ